MRDELAKELEQIGLSENEAKVYLAGLELGPSTAQMIAAKATVSRPTTYIMIESLIKRGLMSSFQKGKKRMFIAENPEVLGKFIDEEINRAQKKKSHLSSLVAALSKEIVSSNQAPKVRVFEDLAGLVQLQEHLIENASHTKTIRTMSAVDDARNFVALRSMAPLWKRISDQNIRVRSIYTTSGAPQKHDDSNWQNRRLPIDRFPFHGELTIYGNFASSISYNGRISAVLIEDSAIVSLLETMFDLAWEEAKKYE